MSTQGGRKREKKRWKLLSRVPAVWLDNASHQVRVNGGSLNLPNKPNQVLYSILSQSPDPVAREELINDLWQGNFLTGEKGLNQALWMIRSQLQDAGGDSGWISTLPRCGYQWIGPQPESNNTAWSKKSARHFPPGKIAMGLFGVCMMTLVTVLPLTGENSQSGTNVAQSGERVVAVNGTYAYQEGQTLMVRNTEGCVFRFVSAHGGQVVSPSFSNDGSKLAMNIIEGNSCKMRVFDFETREMQEFEFCLNSVST